MFHYEGGLRSFVLYLNRNKEKLHQQPIYVDKNKDGCIVEIAMQYNDGYAENIFPLLTI